MQMTSAFSKQWLRRSSLNVRERYNQFFFDYGTGSVCLTHSNQSSVDARRLNAKGNSPTTAKTRLECNTLHVILTCDAQLEGKIPLTFCYCRVKNGSSRPSFAYVTQ